MDPPPPPHDLAPTETEMLYNTLNKGLIWLVLKSAEAILLKEKSIVVLADKLADKLKRTCPKAQREEVALTPAVTVS